MASGKYRGAKVVDRDGDKIGKVDEIYLDRETEEPEWGAGKHRPVRNALILRAAGRRRMARRRPVVPYEKDMVKDAPAIEPDEELSQAQEDELYGYYGLAYSEDRSDTGSRTARGSATSPTATWAKRP
jgi:PRC-barrel domain